MDSVSECLSCFDVQHRRLRSVRDRYGHIRFHRTRGGMQKLLITLKRQTLSERKKERERERIMWKGTVQ